MSRVVEEHWNAIYRDRQVEYWPPDKCCYRASEFFSNVAGKTLLEIGCGAGHNSMYWAQQGAMVTAIDISEQGVQNTMELFERYNLSNARALTYDAFEIDQLGQFDLVFGSMILHHLEPFDQFVDVLARSMAPGGKAFFWENNAMSRLLVWCREHLAGRLWIPKYSDPDEFPLTPQEVDLLKKRFVVDNDYPVFFFFELGTTYLVGNRFRPAGKALDKATCWIAPLRKLSYRQDVRLEKPT